MNVLQSFEARFGHAADLRVMAHGRVNLLGEHTDYNNGYVLPMAIPQTTEIALSRMKRDCIEIVSAQQDGTLETYTLGDEQPRGRWCDYAQGVTHILIADGFSIGGARLFVDSTIPSGSGLSSSAALTVAIARAFAAAYELKIGEEDIAMVAHRAEHDFVGVPVGIMDPMAVCLADTDAPIFLDTHTREFKRVPLPRDSSVVVIDSGVRHSNAASGYATRRRECERAATLLGVGSLRAIDERVGIIDLPHPLAQRVRHVLTENRRVRNAVDAMREDDAVTLGRLFDESHLSMRDDFEVSVPAVDRLVVAARSQPGCLGARLTGGGFGGAIVALVRRDAAASVIRGALTTYHQGGSERARALVGAA